MNYLQTHKRAVFYVIAVFVVAYGFYFKDPIKTESVLAFAWRFAIPLVLAAMVGVIGERSGVVNIGIEGQMLTSAFTSFVVSSVIGNMLVGMFVGIITGMVMGGFLAWAAVKWQMDQIIAGVVLNIVAAGITSFYYKQGLILPGLWPKFHVPVLGDIPLIGHVFFERGFFGLFTLVLVVFLQWALFKTRWGLRTRASGEYPSAADTAGVNVVRLRLINVALAGALAGCAGTYLALEATGTFERGFTSGRGFLALAILIFGVWYPNRVMFAALFFGLMAALASQLQADQVVNIPQQFVNLLPYVLTLVVLGVAAGRVRPPAAAGQPFKPGGE